jgi:cbb3-type cytochrome oxidase cytochrome c subunit
VNYGPLIFLASFFALSASWFGFVLTPQIQLGRQQQQTNSVNTAELYPQSRPGEARQGLEIYRANGCAACHSQQVGQTGTAVDVVLMETGTNLTALADALKANTKLANVSAPGLAGGLPKTVLGGVSVSAANHLATILKTAGAKTELRLVPLGPDIMRGWGLRHSVAADFLFDSPVMLGSQRVGPDLANVGARWPDANWHLAHLYAPRSVIKDSPMPSYRFLFEKRKIKQQPSSDALQLLKEFAPPAGFEIVPRPEAKVLVAYLQSLHANTPLFEAPLTPPPAPAASTNNPAAATNAPAK